MAAALRAAAFGTTLGGAFAERLGAWFGAAFVAERLGTFAAAGAAFAAAGAAFVAKRLGAFAAAGVAFAAANPAPSALRGAFRSAADG